MKFESLTIEVERWGENKGKLSAVLCIRADKVKTTLTLPDDVGEKVLQLSKEAIIDAVEQTSNDFIFELTTSIPTTLNLTNNQ